MQLRGGRGVWSVFERSGYAASREENASKQNQSFGSDSTRTDNAPCGLLAAGAPFVFRLAAYSVKARPILRTEEVWRIPLLAFFGRTRLMCQCPFTGQTGFSPMQVPTYANDPLLTSDWIAGIIDETRFYLVTALMV